MTTDKVEKLSFLYKIMDTADDGSYKLLDSLSGVLNINGEELLYHVIFVKKKRMYSPVAVLSNGEIIEVINRASEAMSEVDGKGKPRYDKPSKVPPDLRYHYFKYKNMFYKFSHRLLWTDDHSINTVSNQTISYVINEKMFTKDLFNDFIDKRKEYYWYPDVMEYDIFAAIDVISYMYHTLGRVIYCTFMGAPGTGKSVGITVSSYLQHNAWIGGRTSVPSAVRLIHLFGISLCQDEFEKMNKDARVDFVGVMNTGFNNIGRYTITNMGNKDITKQVVSFRSFCPKCFTCNSLHGFDISFLDRCYVSHSIKQQAHTRDIYQLSAEETVQFQALRDKMFVYVLFNWKELVNTINEIKLELEGENVFGRAADKNSILLGIIKHFKGEEYMIQVKEFIANKPAPWAIEHIHSMEEMILETIVDYWAGEGTWVKVPNTVLHNHLLIKMNMNANDKYAPSNQKPRKILKDLGLLRKKENIEHTNTGGKQYVISIDELHLILKKNDYTKILEKLVAKKPIRPLEPIRPISSEPDGFDKSDGFLSNKKQEKPSLSRGVLENDKPVQKRKKIDFDKLTDKDLEI